MEKLKNKHDHALTQWLKVIIFAVLLMAPFFSVLTRCLYVTCNKNAKDSYSDIQVSRSLNVELPNTLSSGLTYYCSYKEVVGNTQNKIRYASVSIDWIDYGATNQDYIAFYLLNTGTYTMIYLYTDIALGPSYQLQNVWGNTLNEFSFIPSNNDTMAQSSPCYLNLIYTSQITLDNAFEYSVNQLTQTPIFNWVQNTAIYTPVNAMTTGLGFNANNNVLALLITYWTLLTTIYIIFDIVLSIFTKITHLICGNA